MFLSLVRPERISSPITNSAAVTRSRVAEVVAVMMVLMPGRGSLPCHCGQCGFKPPEAGNRNYLGDQVCSGDRRYRKVRGLRSEMENDDAPFSPPPWSSPRRPRP